MGRNNNDDFGFDDDLFGDDDDDLFGDTGGGDLRGSVGGDDDDENFDFGDENEDIDLGDDNEDFDLDLGSADDVTFDDEEEEPAEPREGPSRAFILIAGVMILFFVVGLGILLFALSRGSGPTPFDLTSTSIAQTNVARAQLIEQTQTQSAAFANLTATATLFTATPSPTNTPEPSPTFTPTLSPTPTETPSGGPIGLATDEPTPTEEVTEIGQVPTEPITANSVELTATALVALFQTPVEQATAIPTAIGGATTGGTTGGTTTGGTGGALPDTGLFDDLVAGGGVGGLFLMSVGLVGMIVMSRKLRTVNSKKR